MGHQVEIGYLRELVTNQAKELEHLRLEVLKLKVKLAAIAPTSETAKPRLDLV